MSIVFHFDLGGGVGKTESILPQNVMHLGGKNIKRMNTARLPSGPLLYSTLLDSIQY